MVQKDIASHRPVKTDGRKFKGLNGKWNVDFATSEDLPQDGSTLLHHVFQQRDLGEEVDMCHTTSFLVFLYQGRFIDCVSRCVDTIKFHSTIEWIWTDGAPLPWRDKNASPFGLRLALQLIRLYTSRKYLPSETGPPGASNLNFKEAQNGIFFLDPKENRSVNESLNRVT